MLYTKEQFPELAKKMADDVMKADKTSYRGKRTEGREMLEKHILEELQEHEEIDDESEDCEMISEGAAEMFGESWDNRY